MPVSSHRPDLHIPNIGLYEFLYGDLTEEDENKIAVNDIADGTTTTFAQLRTYVGSVAGSLASKNVGVGSVVALHCPNSLAFIVYAHAIWRIGATLTPVSLLASEEHITAQLRDSEADLLLTVGALGDHARRAAETAGFEPEQIIAIDSHSGMMQMLAERRRPPQAVDFDPATHTAVLPYSSGTTGVAKGVCLSHRSLVANALQSADQGLTTRDDVVFGVLPFFNIYGLTEVVNLTVKQRGTVVTQPRFELRSFLRAHQDFRVTFSFVTPPVATLLARHPSVENYDLSSLRAIISGAAPIDRAAAGEAEQRLHIRVSQSYGLTEAASTTHLNLDPAIPLESVGRPVANTSHKLVDLDTHAEISVPDSGTSAVGELWVKGPQVMMRYLHDSGADGANLHSGCWLGTGDLAVQDSSGNLYIVDRVKEVIERDGGLVSPTTIESVLLTHPEVTDAAVVGIPGPHGSQVPKAFVVHQQSAVASEDDLIRFVADNVEWHQQIAEVEFVTEIPKTSAGNILRRLLHQGN